MSKMRIIVDGMGGDNAPQAIVEGVVQASAKLPAGYEICLVGREDCLRRELAKYDYDARIITISHAEEVIAMEDAPVKAVRTKKKSSLVSGIQMVKSGEGDIFISAGNSRRSIFPVLRSNFQTSSFSPNTIPFEVTEKMG